MHGGFEGWLFFLKASKKGFFKKTNSAFWLGLKPPPVPHKAMKKMRRCTLPWGKKKQIPDLSLSLLIAHGIFQGQLHPGRLTWNLRIHPWKRRIIFQTIIFRFYVNLRGCMSTEKGNSEQPWEILEKSSLGGLKAHDSQGPWGDRWTSSGISFSNGRFLR